MTNSVLDWACLKLFWSFVRAGVFPVHPCSWVATLPDFKMYIFNITQDLCSLVLPDIPYLSHQLETVKNLFSFLFIKCLFLFNFLASQLYMTWMCKFFFLLQIILKRKERKTGRLILIYFSSFTSWLPCLFSDVVGQILCFPIFPSCSQWWRCSGRNDFPIIGS